MTKNELDLKTYQAVPVRILDALRAYADEKRGTGGFLRSCLENDLRQAFFRADAECRECLYEIVLYIHWEIPDACHGSREAVSAWLSSSGGGT